MYACISSHGGADVYPDGRGVDELDMLYSLRSNTPDMSRKRPAPDFRSQCRDKAFKHHSRLSGTGNARDDRQPPFWEAHIKRFHGMYLRGGKLDRAVRKQTLR